MVDWRIISFLISVIMFVFSGIFWGLINAKIRKWDRKLDIYFAKQDKLTKTASQCEIFHQVVASNVDGISKDMVPHAPKNGSN